MEIAYAAGWKSIGVDEEFGGAGAPHSCKLLVEELISGGNTAFWMRRRLTYGASDHEKVFGTPEQRALWRQAI